MNQKTLTLKRPPPEPRYTVGPTRLMVFGGGEIRSIIDPEGVVICVTIGSEDEATGLVKLLNRGLDAGVGLLDE